MPEIYFQVDVPIRNSVRPEQCGLHVFTGAADTGSAALRIARDTCDAAAAARKAGRPAPGRRPDGWSARGLRCGWVLDWTAATVDVWGQDRRLRLSRSHFS
ncbi:hypothetical protein PV394_05445 [Streptomyces sp. NE06-03E]|uniref:hypothetical protein n=1 Tax=Streptomyces sp. NE06-03E TaxID=3028695 RepID=UPI0029BDF33F|nr:hypothetical protein [Streptomyces sp. NE06-03E]MDX3054583.1 hypothetical protein [Streptomyces sp. NE06-03E]